MAMSKYQSIRPILQEQNRITRNSSLKPGAIGRAARTHQNEIKASQNHNDSTGKIVIDLMGNPRYMDRVRNAQKQLRVKGDRDKLRA